VAKTAKLTFHPTGPHLSNVKFTINGAAASCSGWRCPLGNLGPAGIAKVTLTATPTQIGTLLWDATAASAAADPTPADATRSGSVVVGSPHANLSVQLTPAPPAVAVVHGLLHFHVVVHNGGPETAVGAKLRWQALGIHLDELGIFPSSGGCSSSGACDLGSIAPGKDASVAVFGRPATTGAIEYTATASTATADPNPSNNRTTGTVTVNPAIADIGVTVTAPATGHVNTGLLFYFSPTNAGPTLAPRLKFTFHATGPHLTHLVWGPSYQQICVGNSTCLIGDIPVAPSGGLEFSAVPTQTGTLSWTIQVTSDATDPSPGNNIQSGQITITN
jgi:hypothetical protein